MPKRSACVTKSQTETTLLKYVDSVMSRRPQGSVSSTSLSDTSTNSLFSHNRSEFSERTSSTVPPVLPPRHGVRQWHNQTTHIHQTFRPSRTQNSSPQRRSHNRRNTARSPPFLQSRCLIIMAIISVTASAVTCCFVTLCFVFKIAPILEDNTFQEGDYEACVPCKQLHNDHCQSAAHRDLFTVKIFPDKLEYYCARNTGQMSSLIQMIMDQRKSDTVVQPHTKHKVHSTPVSAHRYLIPGGAVHSQGERRCEKDFCPLQLNNSYPTTSRQYSHDVTIHGNHIEIMYSGWYFVYSSIYIWSQNDASCRQPLNQTFRHAIMRIRSDSLNESGSLVKSAHSCCEGCKDDYHTSYAAGVFELKKRDQISVHTPASSHVLFQDNGSYLGLIMLSSLNASTLKVPFV